MKKITFLFLAITLSACSVSKNTRDLSQAPTFLSSSSSSLSTWKLYRHESGFTLRVPQELQEFIGIELDSNPRNLPSVESYYLDVKDVPSSTSCDVSALGNLQEDLISIPTIDATTYWTKMPVFNAYDRFLDAVCVPSTEGCTEQEIFEGKCNSQAATYSFCSQKGEKTVFICLKQMADNPEMAKKIFSSFRWLED